MVEEAKKHISELKQQLDAVEMEIAGYHGEYQRLQAELRALDEKGKTAAQRRNSLRSSLGTAQQKLELANKVPHVSDHAVVRYLERKLKLNLDQIRAEILTPDLVDKMVRLGDGKYGFAVVKDRTVVTYLE